MASLVAIPSDPALHVGDAMTSPAFWTIVIILAIFLIYG